MNADTYRHQLAAIVNADIVGYSRLMAEDKITTIRTLKAYRSEITDRVHRSGNRPASRCQPCAGRGCATRRQSGPHNGQAD